MSERHSETFHVKRSDETHRRQPTGLCPCGNQRHNPKDGYCRTCRNAASARHNRKQSEELKRLRALEQQLSKGKDNGQSTKEDATDPG